jgi:RHS repeat-associated protein
VTSLSDAQNTTLSFTYGNEYGHAYLTEISAVVGIDNITTRATYDYYRGWITAIQEPKGPGYEYLYSYDLLGRVTKKEFPLLPGQQTRSYLEAIYDDANRMVTIIDQLRHYTTRHYDRLGRLTDIKWYTGEYGSGVLYSTASQSYRYDNRVISVTDAGNDTTSFTYDFLGRQTQVTYPDASSVSYAYDDANNKVTFTNGRGYERIYWYDWLSHLVRVDEEYDTGVYATTTYQYDEVGHLLSFTDAENHTTSFMYESFFGLAKATYPDSEFELYTYDDAGNMVAFTDCMGNTTSYTYDDIYRISQITYADHSVVSYTYDLNSNRIRMDDDAPGTGDYVAYTYDQWNRLVTETRHISLESYAVSYEYDVGNNVTEITYPDSMEIVYEYDDLNRMREIKRYVDGQNDEILFSNPQYDAESLLTQFEYGNGLYAFYTFDSRDRPLTIDVKDGSTPYLDLDYTYDNNSNITQISDQYRTTSGFLSLAQTREYVYDGLDRLIEEKKMGIPVHTYSYDKAGNRTGKDSLTYTVNVVNEVTALSDGTSFTYDDNGNRIQKTKDDDTWDYTYDYANRLTKVEKNQVTIGDYVYDGNGKRLQKTENDVTTTYIYSGINVMYEKNATGYTSYVYGPTGLLAKRTTIDQESNTYYYHKNHLGSTRSVTDSNKTVISTTTYQPFGDTDNEEGSEQYLYTGKERDSTGLYYYGARYYDPEIGRFVTRDRNKGSKWCPRSLNRYSYCYNNPVCYTDPDGKIPKHVIEGGDSHKKETAPVPPYTGDRGSFLSTINSSKAYLQFAATLLVVTAEKIATLLLGIAIQAGIFFCWVAEWFYNLVNDKIFIEPMREITNQGYLPIYEGEPEYCTILVRKDEYGIIHGLEIYDSKGNLVGVWTTNEFGEIYSGWMMVEGKYMIFDSEKKQWLEAPDDWKPGDPLPNQSTKSNSDTKSGNGGNNEGNFGII